MVIAVLLIAIVLSILAFRMGLGSESSSRVVLRGSGATFLQPQLEAWIEAFMKEHKNIVIEYSGIGSGAGQQQFFKGLTDFCGSDPPLSRSRWEEYKGRVLQLPVILGAVAIIYNVPEIPRDVHLNLTGDVIALIYRGEIRYWDDPRIARLNPAIADRLPHREIVPVYRLDANEVTEVFTQFLHSVAPDLWPKKLVGKVVDWPLNRGIAVRDDEGMVSTIKRVRYSIGYVELSYAIENNLQIAAIMNRKGLFIPPTVAIQSSASYIHILSYIPTSLQRSSNKVYNITIYSDKWYPITVATYVFMRRDYDEDRARVVKKFLEWLYHSDRDLYDYTSLSSIARDYG